MYQINPLGLHLHRSITGARGSFYLKNNPEIHCCSLRSIDQNKLPDKVLVLHPICLSTLIQQDFLFICQCINV